MRFFFVAFSLLRIFFLFSSLSQNLQHTFQTYLTLVFCYGIVVFDDNSFALQATA